jgi:hypothetical protein
MLLVSLLIMTIPIETAWVVGIDSDGSYPGRWHSAYWLVPVPKIAWLLSISTNSSAFMRNRH